MKPAIYTFLDLLEHRRYCLVDEDSEIRMKWKNHVNHRRSFGTAIRIDGLKPGQFLVHKISDTDPALITGECPWNVRDLKESIIAPTPEVISNWPGGTKFGDDGHVWAPAIIAHSPGTDQNPEYFYESRTTFSDPKGKPKCRGIHLRAAEVMLRLSASWNNFKYDRVTETRSFGAPRIENTEPSLPWDKWAFLCAWFWSDWEDRSHPKKLTQQERFEDMQKAGYPNSFKAFEALHRRLFPKPTRS